MESYATGMVPTMAMTRLLAPWTGTLLLAAGASLAPRAGAVGPAARSPGAWSRPKAAYLMPFDLPRVPRVAKNGRFGAPRAYGTHDGVDFAVPVGTPVYAARSGIVVRVHRFGPLADWGRGYGGLAIVAHSDGSRTWYCHLERVDVRLGQMVTTRTRLGLSGDEDNGDSQGPHLHFMIYKGGKPLNPSRVLSRRVRRG